MADEMPEAPPKSDLDPEEELEVEGGTLVWRDPLASGDPLESAYLWPVLIIALVLVALLAALL